VYPSSTHPLGKALSVVALLACIWSCENSSGLEEDRRVGVIAFFGDPVVIAAPDTVFVGQSFSVLVRTYGDGCISQGGTEVQSVGLSIDVTPYDVHSGARICTDILNMFDHTAALTIARRGTAEIRFHGRRLPEDLTISELREVVVK
jgi:hypothetical protein